MDYIAKESDVLGTVNDFVRFCDFIENKKPFATTKGVLSVKACYELNSLLRYPAQNAKTTDRMEKYPSINLWFAVALQAGFIVYSDAKGGKIAFDVTGKYADFKKMNIFSQYMLIFQIWYRYADPEIQYNETGVATILSGLMDPIFTQLSESDSQKWIKYDKKSANNRNFNDNPLQIMMGHYYKVARTLRDLNLIVFEESDVIHQDFYWPILEKLKPTDFGISIAKACTQRKYAAFSGYAEKYYLPMFWEDDGDDATDEEIEEDDADDEDISFIEPFVKYFPQDCIDVSAIDLLIFEHDDSGADDNRIFDCKVSLGKKCYRVIRCLPEHTFEDLHIAIQKAFDFDDDHLYAFYLDGKRYSKNTVNAPYMEEPPSASEVCLNDVRLINNQHILYLFDFGDCWHFDIAINIKNEEGIVLKWPKIIESVGEAPEQYS